VRRTVRSLLGCQPNGPTGDRSEERSDKPCPVLAERARRLTQLRRPTQRRCCAIVLLHLHLHLHLLLLLLLLLLLCCWCTVADVPK
jgi:hypothetical protein